MVYDPFSVLNLIYYYFFFKDFCIVGIRNVDL